jgi:hypothetical protein
MEDEHLRRGPCTETELCNWVPRSWEAAAPAEFQRAGRAPGRGGVWARTHAHLGRGGERGLSREGSGEGERRWPAVTPAAAAVSGGERAMPSNGGRHKLLWLLGSELEGLGALETWRGGELAGGRQWQDGGGRRRGGKGDGSVFIGGLAPVTKW